MKELTVCVLKYNTIILFFKAFDITIITATKSEIKKLFTNNSPTTVALAGGEKVWYLKKFS